MKNHIGFFFFLIVLLLAGCGSEADTVVSDPVTNSGVAILNLLSDKDTINSDSVDTASVTVRALDSSNVAVEDAVISISADSGALSSGTVTTDETGSATFSFDSGVETSNQVATITASSESIVATKAISILGSSVIFSTDRTTVGLNGTTTANLTMLVRDGAGDPVENVTITLAADLGLIDGFSTVDLITDVSGQATAIFAGGANSGTANVVLTGPGSESLSILISGQQYSLSDTKAGSVSISSSDTITLTWIDAAGNPVVDANVQFSATKGTFDATGNTFVSGLTDAAGRLSTVFNPVSVGQDAITATSGSSVVSLPIDILADDPNSLALGVDPSVLSRAQGGFTPTATVSATVLDSLNRAVQGVQVAFSLTDGPGGGEVISPAIVTTNSAGVATATLSSGGLISAQDGVTILAKVVNSPSILDTATLTIADQAATVVIGQTNKIETLSIGSSEDAYALPFTVLVTDTNGGAIADQAVSLSVYPTQFKTGVCADGDKIETCIVSNTYANEDVNRNGILDLGEDMVFANNRLDPGGVVSIPASVVTDENGFAGFNLVYAKSFGLWIDVEISATTSVSGTESKSIIFTSLSVKEGDTPFISSPFGP